MKRTILTLTIILSFLIFTQSCKKDESVNSTTKTIYVTIKSNETYQFDLGSFGDEEGAGISRQASHFQVSKTERVNYVKIIYTYIPAQDYVGTDEVELKAERGSDGAGPNNEITFFVIKFEITN